MVNTLLYLIAGAMLVASIMELIKHKVFNDEAETVKMVIVGLILSAFITVVLYYSFGLVGEPLAMVFYGLSVYVVQKQLDMQAIRPIIKKIALKKLEEL